MEQTKLQRVMCDPAHTRQLIDSNQRLLDETMQSTAAVMAAVSIFLTHPNEGTMNHLRSEYDRYQKLIQKS